MKSIPLVGSVFGVLLVNAAGATEGINENRGAEVQFPDSDHPEPANGRSDIDAFAQAYPVDSSRDSRDSSNSRMYAPQVPGLVVPATTKDNGTATLALTLQNADHQNRGATRYTADFDVNLRKPSSDSRGDNTLQLQRAGLSSWQTPLPGSEEIAGGTVRLVPALLASTESQYVLSSTSLGGAGKGSVAVQAGSSAALFALQSTIGSWTEQYVYDALGRLTKVTFANGAVTNYTLDNAGNRTNVNTTVP